MTRREQIENELSRHFEGVFEAVKIEMVAPGPARCPAFLFFADVVFCATIALTAYGAKGIEFCEQSA